MQHGIDLTDAEVFIGTTSPELMQELIDRVPAFGIYYVSFKKTHPTTCKKPIYCFMEEVKNATCGKVEILYRMVPFLLDKTLTFEQRLTKAHVQGFVMGHFNTEEQNKPEIQTSLEAIQKWLLEPSKQN